MTSMTMNYSVFKLQNQGGKPGIFWEKETVPKNDRKFSYKKKDQRFPVRRFPGDRHHVDTGLVSLSPDEPPPPPKPAKNFIQRNKAKLVAKPKTEAPKTVTLTQEQLNAILRSVGKVAGGSKNAIKISIADHDNKNEITIESPRRRDYDDSDDDKPTHKEGGRRTKKKEPASENNSIYSLLDNNTKPKALSDYESYESDDSLRIEKKSKTKHHRRKERKSKKDDDDFYNDRDEKNRRQKSQKQIDEDESENVRRRNRRNHSKHRYDDDDDYDDVDEVKERRKKKNSKHHSDDEDDDDYNKHRHRNRSKQRNDSDNETDDIETQARDRKEQRRSEKSRKNKSDSVERKDNGDKLDTHGLSVLESEDKVEELPSPRDKIGLPMDLSWRHMTKAERRRLEIARQKLLDEEERKDEERIHQLNEKYGSPDREEKKPQRHRPPPAPRSDPVTRLDKYDRGRDTETTNYSDAKERRGRRSRSPEIRSRTPEQSPEPPAHTSPLALPRRHMTLAEKKRIEWERERVESVQMQKGGDFDPWGRPGAGAPLRTRSGHVAADYKGRQDKIHNQPIIEEPDKHPPPQESSKPEPKHKRSRSPPNEPPVTKSSVGQLQDQSAVPHAMRSSFVFGNGISDVDRFQSAKERERKAWLADLEKQINEKKMKDTKTEAVDETTWADKLGTYRPAPFPEQPKDTVSGQGDPLSNTGRISSAPEGENATFIRGQNAPIDPATKKELESQRQRYLEHQTAVREQVAEKERLKSLERERKIKEDLEEERKLQAERDNLQKQYEMEQQKLRMKEQQRQEQVNQLKVAMDEAQARALQEKYQRKMQHLEAGGHDTTKLREHLEGELTSRIEMLHTRRERDIQKAKQQLDLQFWGLPKTVEEEEAAAANPTLQPHTAKITPRTEHGGYSGMGGAVTMEPTQVPGLDLSSARTQVPYTQQHQQTSHYRQHQYNQQQHESSHRVIHDPYTEDRVLTPSRFRHLSKPHSDPGSPRREFGTQTGDEVAELLNRSLRRDDSEVQIEYRMEKGKRVRVKSAPKEQLKKPVRKAQSAHDPPPSFREQSSPHDHHHHVHSVKEKEEEIRRKKFEMQMRRGPVKPGSRPRWGYKNPNKKPAAKQSERDPFFEQKRKQSEERRIKREQQLLAMVEANKNVIPDYYVPPPNKARSRSRDRSPFSDFGGGTPREVKQGRRSKSHSPIRVEDEVRQDYLKVNHNDHDHSNHEHSSTNRHGKHQRDRSESPHENKTNLSNRGRARSPPVPAIRHKTDAKNGDRRPGGRYGDVDPLDIPVQNGDFVPFTRTIDVLDPAKAGEPLPLSREATRIANARKMYYESQKPDKFGNRQNVYEDKQRVPGRDPKNPLYNPSLVTDHPTSRQDQILVQLSSLKQSLIQRQRELETFSPTDLEKQDTNLNL